MAANYVIVIHLDRTMKAVLRILGSVIVSLGWAVGNVTAACLVIISSRLMAAKVRPKGRLSFGTSVMFFFPVTLFRAVVNLGVCM